MSEQYLQLPGGRVRILGPGSDFPPVEQALEDPNGLLAIGGDLKPDRLLTAYRQGIFPWYGEGQPILWWSPAPRMVLFPPELKVSRSLRKRLRQQNYEVRFNTAFRTVMEACAKTPRPDQDGTWITLEMIDAYVRLHELGYAVSAETWIDGTLAGGLYGIRIGRMFFGESMFHRVSDASKIAFVHLVRELEAQGCRLIDCQMHTSHLASLGGREIPRHEFCRLLQELIE